MNALDALLPVIPYVENESAIPRIIHQTYKSNNLPPALQQNVDHLKRTNPTWEYRFYDDQGIHDFISATYGPEILSYYNKINHLYPASRADFFRYLVIYACGGVYLDIKSCFIKPIDEVVQADDQFLLANWPNHPGGEYEGFGLREELNGIPGGEYQQWHVISCAGHPFLKAAIARVLNNIRSYKPWIHGVGARGVLCLTGPTAYTLAIHPIVHLHKHRKLNTHTDVSLRYSVVEGSSHRQLYSIPHYKTLTHPVVTLKGLRKYGGFLYSGVQKAKKSWAHQKERLRQGLVVKYEQNR